MNEPNKNSVIADVIESYNHRKMKVIVPYYISQMKDKPRCNELKFIIDMFLSQNADYRIEVDRINSL